MPDNMHIRPITADDFLEWEPLWDSYNAFYGRKGETALPKETNLTAMKLYDQVANKSGLLVFRKVL